MNEVRKRPEAGQVWKHRKGALYTVLGVTSEPDDEKAEKFPVTIFYEGEDGKRWTRTLTSWFGSFTLLSHDSKPVWDGSGLPPVGADVLFNTASSGEVRGTVTGYGVRPSLTGEKAYHRVDIHLVYVGEDVRNQRLLMDVRPLK